jgi:hypothetical protein
MNSPSYAHASGPAFCGATDDLIYCIIFPTRPGGSFVIEASLKVPHGVRLFNDRWPERPSEAVLRHLCLQFGDFSPRPYSVGQAADASTRPCAMALYHDCCRRLGLDATELLVRTYPDAENPEAWTPLAWRLILEAATWQGTDFPFEWTPEAIFGLLLSLAGEGRELLAMTLAAEIARRQPTDSAAAEGEPS